ncbi:hypothetical protein LNV09_16015 [Paucibacter sp. B2R-40]|uniref:hypothetical protein n=1 Tax=Paucibacter sp. B2R-40 TaxID=2893554 RepID=UPI0021E3ACD6|nr:hypothetical protein [Paucibacter sp. B2R-40]MCV2355650.1 hypothetical protein [Paucibacter sp. B2R-40]
MSAVFPPQGGFPFHSSTPQLRTPGTKRGPGLVIVLGLHVLLAWALASGLAKKAIEIIKKPIEMSVIQEAPPPPPPPPKVVKLKEVVKQQTPPPSYVPQAEVTPTVTPPAPVITQVQSEAPRAPVEIAPPVIAAPPAPPPKPAVIKQEISAACPGYQNVLAQHLEDVFDRVGITGTVTTLLKIRGNQIVDVSQVSGPPEYFKYVQNAAKRLRCNVSGAEEVQVLLPVNFRK